MLKYYFVDVENKKLLSNSTGSSIYFTRSHQRAIERSRILELDGFKVQIVTFKNDAEAEKYCNPNFKEDYTILNKTVRL